jgi:predicted Rossmann fold flavoprotein
VGIELEEKWLTRHRDMAFPGVALRVVVGDEVAALCPGEILIDRWGARGPAMVNASRIIARRQLKRYRLIADLAPQQDTKSLADELLKRSGKNARLTTTLADWLVPRPLCREFVQHVLHRDPGWRLPSGDAETALRFAETLKAWPLQHRRPRPLKEAMVTVGGVDLAEIDPATMESKRIPGLYFAGEVMDVDGPSGGFNLQAAFATAQQAVRAVAAGRASRQKSKN